jgi:thiamine kinase-like enzyme
MEHMPDAAKEVRVARWLRRCDVPAARLYPVEQPITIRGHPVTFWETISDSGEKAPAEALGAVLRRVHGCEITESVKLPALDIFERVGGRLEKAATIPRGQIDFLRRRLAELRKAYATLSFPFSPVALHGDAHVKNLMCTLNGATVLIDFEGFCKGPREVDLAVTATEFEIGWHTAADYHAFCDAYGYDVREWSGFEVLRDINLLKMTTWLMQNVGESAQEAEEFQRRLATLRQPTSASRWQPF